MEIRVLGPVEVVQDGKTVPVNRVQVRRLLALFASHPDGIASDALIDALWPESPPSNPRAALSVHLSRLRTTLGDDRDLLVATGDGYVLTSATDLANFRAAITAAEDTSDPNARVDHLAGALERWRGEPFGDLGDLDRLRIPAVEIRELYFSATTRLLGTHAELAEHAEVVRRGESMANEHLDRERLVAIVARSMAATGRRTDALGLLDRCQTWIRQHLGIDATELIRTLERKLLDGAVDLVPLPVVNASVAAVAHPLVNRDTELAALLNANRATCVVGEPGIGKTALLHHVASVLRDDSHDVRMFSATASPEHPMQVLADMVLSAIDDGGLDAADDTVRGALRRVLPRHDFGRAASMHAMSRDAMVELAASFLGHHMRSRGTRLIVDDCQWLDRASAAVVESLADEPGLPVLLGSRPAPEPHLKFIHSGEFVEPLQLQVFTAAEVDRMIHAEALTLPHSTTANELQTLTGGNPLFLRLVFDLLADGVNLDALPSSILVAVHHRIATLSANARETLGFAAVCGERFHPSTMRALRPDADADLREAEGAGVLACDTAADMGQFRHALVRAAVYQQLPEGRRIELHIEVGEALEAAGASPTELVRHFTEAAAFDPYRAAEAHHRAALEYSSVYDVEAVEQHCAAGRELLGGMDQLLESRLAVLQGRAQRTLHRGGFDPAIPQAVELARTIGDHQLFADAAVALCLQGWSMEGASPDGALDLLSEAVALDLDPDTRALAGAAAATYVLSDHNSRARSMYNDAVQLALDECGPSTQAEVLQFAGWGLSHPADFATWIETNQLLGDLAGADPNLRWSAASDALSIGVIRADRSQFEHAMADLRELAAHPSLNHRDWELAHMEANYSTIHGDLDVADAHIHRSWELGERTNSTAWMRPIFGASLLMIRRAQGRLEEMLPLIEAAIEEHPTFLAWHACMASAAAQAGDTRRCQDALDVAAGRDFADLLPDPTWSGVTVLLSDAIVAVEDRPRAETLYQIMLPYADRISWSGVSTPGPMATGLAGLAEVLDRPDDAAAHRARGESLMRRLISR